MVDIDKIKDRVTGEKEEKEKKASSSSNSSSSSSSNRGQTETFELDDGAMAEPGDSQLADTSKDWASDHSELNYDAGSGGSVESYMRKQVDECEELYDNVVDLSKDHMDTIEEFTLYFHALTLNMAQNRIGVFNILKDEYNMSDREAAATTQEIMERAGEVEAIQEIFEELMYSLQGE